MADADPRAASADPNDDGDDDDSARFDYSLTGWAQETHGRSIYCVAFCNKLCGEGEEEEEEEGEVEERRKAPSSASTSSSSSPFPLDRVLASVGGRRITVYYAPPLPPPPGGENGIDDGNGNGAAAPPPRDERRQRRELEQLERRLPFSVLQTYVDASPEEEFYACRWARREPSKRESRRRKEGGTDVDAGGTNERLPSLPVLPLLLAGGKRGVLRVVDPSLGGLSWTGRGHGGAINDVAVHPSRPSLALTASRDQSVRLWNLEARCCVAVFGGGGDDGAHVAEVLSIDWHPVDALAFASCGYESSVKIWSLEAIAGAVEASYEHERRQKAARREAEEARRASGGDDDGSDDDDGAPPFPSAPFAPRVVPSPRFSSQRVHRGGVADCVRWLGPGVLLSKSTDDRVIAWSVEGLRGLPSPVAEALSTSSPAAAAAAESPDPDDGEEKVRLRQLNLLKLSHADNVWFVRFSLDRKHETLACGGRGGRVCVFDPRRVESPAGEPAEPRKKLRCAVPRGARSAARERTKGDGGVDLERLGDSVVRQTALSDDGSTLLASCDDGTVWRFDRPSSIERDGEEAKGRER